ncbi:MAG: DUF5615 family PIN-like protein [Gemmatimonadaceae bacterium]|nr:DUF5615 family PIN-like protein [Gloeobacterales cyanobacterium ES-bin-141]
MSVTFYFDECANGEIVKRLRIRQVDVLTVQEDGKSGSTDVDVLERACELGRVLFTQDEDFLSEVARRQRAWLPFTGVLYAHPRTNIGECAEDLNLIAKAMKPTELAGEILYLPL